MRAALFEILIFVLIWHVLALTVAFILIKILGWPMFPAIILTLVAVLICERLFRLCFKTRK